MKIIDHTEKRVLLALAQAWNTFLLIENTSDDDRRDFRAVIHHAQDIVLAHAVIRVSGGAIDLREEADANP